MSFTSMSSVMDTELALRVVVESGVNRGDDLPAPLAVPPPLPAARLAALAMALARREEVVVVGGARAGAVDFRVCSSGGYRNDENVFEIWAFFWRLHDRSSTDL
jgi:hypothetical protein